MTMQEITLQRRPWPIRAWNRSRSVFAAWRKRQAEARAIYSAVRQIPGDIELREIGRSDQDWYCRISRIDNGENFVGVYPHPYVAIRRATLTAQFRIAAEDGEQSS